MPDCMCNPWDTSLQPPTCRGTLNVCMNCAQDPHTTWHLSYVQFNRVWPCPFSLGLHDCLLPKHVSVFLVRLLYNTLAHTKLWLPLSRLPAIYLTRLIYHVLSLLPSRSSYDQIARRCRLYCVWNAHAIA